MKYTIFTDGSSRGNPGPGGWAAIIIGESKITEIGGHEENTTNNRMELQAVIEALSAIKAGEDILVYTDSSYLINGITKWVKGWKKIGWMTRAKADVMNRDLWEKLDSLVQGKNIKWQYVGGHAGVSGNERCDEIATSFADNKPISLYDGGPLKYPVKNILNVSAQPVKLADKSRKNAKAYSYISSVKKEILVHKTWDECEKRVKGVKGARYKKALDAEDEEKIIAEFSEI